MKLLSTLLIDDEQLALVDITTVLTDVGLFDIQASVCSVAEAQKFLIQRNERVDVIFCDIQMPSCSGLDAAKLLRTYCHHLVFCTGFEQYALEAHQLLVDGYLLKPIDQLKVLELAEKMMRNSATDKKKEDVTDHFMLADLPVPPKRDEAGNVIKEGEKDVKYWKRVEVKDVALISRSGNYLHFYGLTRDEKFCLLGAVNWELNKFYTQYSAIEHLFPVNQSAIVNKQYIKKITKEAIVVGSKYLSITDIGRPFVDRYLKKVLPRYADVRK